MSQTTQAVVQSLVERAVKLGDRQLAADIRAFAAQRQFGLVFEHNRPERLRLYGKPVMRGDTVQVLPARGEKENAHSQLLWRVTSLDGQTARLTPYKSVSYDENDNEDQTVAIKDVVTVAEYDQPIYAGLKETGRVERGGDKPYQVVINGENYHALETLAFAYAGKVDCIYIDPPYNTGARDWKYNNDYVDSSDAYRHSKWLAFMERRLKLAKQLLNPNDSVLIVTIDEKEYARLGLLLERIFPGGRIQMVSSVINPAGVARQGEFARSDEYIYFVYFGEASPKKVPLGDDWLGGVNNSCKGKLHWNSLMRTGTNSLRSDRPNLFYPIYVKEDGSEIDHIGASLSRDESREDVPSCPGCKTVWPIRTNGAEGNWQISQAALRVALEKGFVKLGRFTERGMAISYLKSGEQKKVESGLFPIIGRRADGSVIVDDSEYEANYIPSTQWRIASHDASRNGSGMLRKMIPNRSFPFPKSLYAVEDAVRFFIANKPNALVIDFFSGSGTTAHAVMRLNHQDGGYRRSISVTNNEVSEDEAKKLTKRGLRQGDPDWEALGICQYITKPRITAAITGKTPEGDPVKGDYKFTDEFPMADGFEENAVFFDLTYEDPDAVELGVAFEEIAPLLWLRAGARGRVIEHEEPGYAISDAYAVLFDFAAVGDFIKALKGCPEVSCAFVITDDTARFAGVKAQLPGLDVVRLYENYLQSFKIAAEDAVR